MFAFIARQWRLATPLFLTALTAVIIAGTALAPASAHSSHDRPVSFSGFANGVRGSVDTVFDTGLNKFITVSSAKFANCATGNVEKHGTSRLGPVTSGNPLIDFVLLQDGSFSLPVVSAQRCGAEITAKLKKGADGVGSVDAHAAITCNKLEVQALDGQLDRNCFVDGFVAPQETDALITFGTGTVIESEAKAFCNTEGHAKVEADIMGADFNNDLAAESPGNDTQEFNEFLGLENQPVNGLEGSGYTAFINEVTSSVSGSHGSVTVIGLHLFGNGLDIRIAESHADIKCPK